MFGCFLHGWDLEVRPPSGCGPRREGGCDMGCRIHVVKRSCFHKSAECAPAGGEGGESQHSITYNNNSPILVLLSTTMNPLL